MTPREHIEQIRAVQAPPGADCTEVERKRDAHQRGLAEQFLRLIAEQLYSSEAHFALELLQNADDNSYESECIPQIEIIVEENRLTFKNNERGFLREHVESICKAGSSTKVLDKSERIGEKGIGFKSVFLVSDAPEVHSNGYRFRFDHRKEDSSSLIRPVWIDLPIFDGAGTTIVLPMQKGKSADAAVKCFAEPENLLFLRRIRRILIDNKVTGRRTELLRQDEGSVAVVTKTCGSTNTSTTSRFFTHRECTSLAGVNEKLRPGVHSSEVVIALPLGPDGMFDDTTSRSLYAFLPVKRSSLKFVAHADFVLTANREGVREDLPWNIRLRDQLGAALANALLAAKLTDAGRTGLRFVIRVDQVTDAFLHPVMRIATERLRESQCIPCEAGMWTSPNSALRHDPESLIAGLLNDDVGCRILACQFVDASVRRIDGALELLGCRQCDSGMLRQCLSSEGFVDGKVPRWFGELLVAIHSLSDSERLKFKSLRVIRLNDDKTTPPAAGIYTRGKEGRTSDYGFESRVKLLHKGVLADLGEEQRKNVLRLLKDWHIGPLLSHTIINTLILPLHGRPDGIDEREAIGHVRFVRDKLKDYLDEILDPRKREEALLAIVEKLRIRVAGVPADQRWNGYACIETLYLCEPYCSASCLREVLGSGLDRVCVSDRYVVGTTPIELEADRKKWAEFFTFLGAHKLPRVLCDDHSDGWRASPEVSDVISSGDERKKLALLQIIADNWSKYSLKMAVGTKGLEQSNFCIELRKMQLKDSSGRSTPIDESQLDCVEIREVFGESARCITFEWKNDEFSERLGVSASPTVREVLRHLKDSSDQHVTSTGERVAPVMLYQFLMRHFSSTNREIIKRAFQSEKLILCHREGRPHWMALSEVVWSLEPAFQPFTHKGVLAADSIRGLKEFFVSQLGVSEDLKPEDWVEILSAVSKDRNLDPVARASHAVPIYRKLDSFATQNAGGWLDLLKNQECILTKSHGWKKPCQFTLIPDDDVLCEAFKNSSKIWFIDVPIAELPRMQGLFSTLNLKSISNTVELALVESATSARSVHRAENLWRRWPDLMRYVYHKHQKRYQEHLRNGLLTKLHIASVHSCDEVRLVASYAGERQQVSRPAWLEVREGAAKIWESEASSDSWRAVGLELARVLRLQPEVGFIFDALLSPAAPSSTLDQLKVGELPRDEANRWRAAGDPAGTEAACDESPARTDAVVSGVKVDSTRTLPPTATNRFAQAVSGGSEHSEIGTRSLDVASSIGLEHSEANFKGGATTHKHIGSSTAGSRRLAAHTRQVASTSDRGAELEFAKSDRLISYLEPSKGADEDSGGKELKLRIARAAVEVAMSKEIECRRVPTEMSHLNAGYDIESRSAAGDLERLIEVKGLHGLWGAGGITMSRTQFDFAQDHRDTAWLYVVENALDPFKQMLYRIKNPAIRFTGFGIDCAWKSFAE